MLQKRMVLFLILGHEITAFFCLYLLINLVMELEVILLYDFVRKWGRKIKRLRRYRRAIASRNKKNKYKIVRKRRKEMKIKIIRDYICIEFYTRNELKGTWLWKVKGGA